MPFAAALTVRLPPHRRLSGDTVYHFSYCGRDVRVRPIDADSIVKAEWLSMVATSFESRDAALDFAHGLRGHLRLAAVHVQFGIDAGTEEVLTRVGEQLAADGRLLLSVIHGIHVYEETGAQHFLWAHGAGWSTSTPAGVFEQALHAVVPLAPARDGSCLALAADLLSLVDFETSQRARFLTLITALEALSDVQEVRLEADLVSRVESWMAELAAVPPGSADQRSLQSLQSRVAELRFVSIGHAIRRLVRAHDAADAEDGSSNEEFVATCYRRRSELVHGSVPTPDVAPLVSRLRAIVRRVILSVAASDRRTDFG